jgi:uncharacterized protein YdaU (DUF1376 family)
MPIEKPEWFKLNPAKFLSDKVVDAMSAEELGACFRLLCRQWIDGDVPDDLVLLARHCRLSEEEMRQAWPILSGFFPVVGPGKRANPFMWIEREKVIEDLERLSDEGTRRARKRWDDVKAKRNAASNATGSAVGSANGNAVGTALGKGAAIQDQTRADQSRPEKRGAADAENTASERKGTTAPPSSQVGGDNEEGKRNGASSSADAADDDNGATADEWPPSAIARHLLEILSLPIDRALLTAVSESIRTLAKARGITLAAAHDLILPKAALAKEEGVRKPWPFWFRDQEYDRKIEGRGDQ